MPEARRRVRVPAHGRWRPRAGRSCRRCRRQRASRSRSTSPTSASGPEYSTQCMAASLERRDASGHVSTISRNELPDLIARDAIVLWFQGRMEYGPRSLGRRSVLARPDSRAVRDRLNLVLKRRVWYQPFCPSLLESEAARVLSDWSPRSPNPHMTMAYMVSPTYREAMAGVIGVDGSCRPQIVDDTATDCFAEVLRAVRRRLDWAPCSTRAITFTANRWCVRPRMRSTSFKR